MRNAYLLCGIQLRGLFRVRDNGARAVAMTILYALVGLMMAGYSAGIAWGLGQVGLGALAPVLMLVTASLVALMTTVLKCGSLLLGCRDYDFVASLPLSAAQHVGGRLLSAYLMEEVFFALILLPAGVVCVWGAGPGGWAAVLLCVLFAPLIPLSLGVAVGALILAAGARTRRAPIVTIVLSMAATLGLMALSMRMPMMGSERLMSLGGAAQTAILCFYPPAAAFMGALEGDWRGFGLFLAASAALAYLTVLVLAQCYGALNGRLLAKQARVGFRMGAMRVQTPGRALYAREIRRLFSTPIYAMNVLIGPMLYIALGAAACAIGARKLTGILELAGIAGFALPAAPLAGAMLTGMMPVGTCAESLEGKTRWILGCAPVGRGAYCSAKILCGLTVQLCGALPGGLLLGLGLGAGWRWTALMMALPAAWSVFTCALGLAINMKWPRYDWVSEQQVVKQGLPVMLSMLTDMIGVLAVGVLTFALIHAAMPILWLTTALALLTGGVVWVLLARGRRPARR